MPLPAATGITVANTDRAIISKTLVIRREIRNGQTVYIVEPYIIAKYYRFHQNPSDPSDRNYKTFIQPAMTCLPAPGGNEKRVHGNDSDDTITEAYDDIMFIDAPLANAPFRQRA